MRLILAAAAACFALPANADYVAKSGKDYVRLQEGACPEAILAMVPADARERFYAAVAHVGGKDYRACWTLLQSGGVYLRYEDTDEGVIPLSEFKAEPGI